MLLWKYLKFCQGTGCEIPQNRRLTNDRTQQRREITLGVHCGQVEHQGLFLCGESPRTMRTGLVCSRHFPDPPGIDGLCPLTISHVGVPPVAISHGNFLLFVTSLTRPVSLLRCSRCLGQSPPCQRGVPRHRRGGGIPRLRLGTSYLITLHYSLKNLPLFT